MTEHLTARELRTAKQRDVKQRDVKHCDGPMCTQQCGSGDPLPSLAAAAALLCMMKHAQPPHQAAGQAAARQKSRFYPAGYPLLKMRAGPVLPTQSKPALWSVSRFVHCVDGTSTETVHRASPHHPNKRQLSWAAEQAAARQKRSRVYPAGYPPLKMRADPVLPTRSKAALWSVSRFVHCVDGTSMDAVHGALPLQASANSATMASGAANVSKCER